MAAPDWNDDFLDLIDALLAEQVDFLIVGAFALAAHGIPRATGDLDVLVRPSAESAPKVIAALRRFGAPLASAKVTEADFVSPGTVYQLGLPPRRIDLLTQISAVPFEEAFATAIEREISGRRVRVLGREALLTNKRATGREKDRLDVEALERRRGRS